MNTFLEALLVNTSLFSPRMTHFHELRKILDLLD